MTYNMTMKKVNIADAKARLSEYLEVVAGGERVVICRRNRPVAELRALPAVRAVDRPLGGIDLGLPDAFFEPLPTEIEQTFYTAPITRNRGASTAAEPRPRSYRPAKRTRRAKP